ncbi:MULTISPECIES: Na+/H+ antiporter NhaC family protein [unclassified Streptomyces]|uniref:Na+/H+ antiporter NhaC family protein n=1 Tax=unclassified Streptomyces TaxID=2593676 RepID=UPI002DD80521|nr:MULTISPECIES: Na+/H+ antiporter NhaC family protein [unclassified Streptomyces]WSA96637.1 permease [Streptomyces sp. NBC_01795]WSS10738.1 permease [Streptomyces sp. NBC_01186]WSS39433.1 permease [Streptomyces sp. NBC_01187]
MSEVNTTSGRSPSVSDAPSGRPGLRTVITVVAIAGLLLSAVAAPFAQAPTLWGLVPIVLFCALALLGMDIVVATVVAVISALLLMLPSPAEAGSLLGDSLGDDITVIGLVIMLGAGVGEVLRTTGIAATIVQGVMRVVRNRGRGAATLGVMVSCLILVASLGTLAGALAIAAPLLLPIVARLGFTRSATASMMFIGGGAGLALAPFVGSNLAIMDAAEVGYLQYLLYGGGPVAALSLVAGLVIVPWMQRRTQHTDDYYDTAELGATDDGRGPRSGVATAAFGVALIGSLVYAVISEAGITFPLFALPTLGIVAGLAGGLSPTKIASTMYTGAARLIHVFLLFWLLAMLFAGIDALKPFQVILATYGHDLQGLSPFAFALVIAVLGWVGVPGATAAQVVLLDKVFGALAASVGIPAGGWVVVLLFASKADTYGPFPNPNMISAMSLARSESLKNIFYTGLLVLVPACAMYAIILFFVTR